MKTLAEDQAASVPRHDRLKRRTSSTSDPKHMEAQCAARAMACFIKTGPLLFRSWLVLALVLASCVERQPGPPVGAYAEKRGYRVIAIRVEPYQAELGRFAEPVKGAGRGAAVGAKDGTGGMVGGCIIGSGGLLLLVCLALTPVAAVTGAIVGAGSAHSGVEVTRATEALQDAILAAKPDEGIREALSARLRELPDQRFEFVYPSGIEDSLSDAQLGSKGIDAVLRLQVIHLDLEVRGEIDPDAAIIYAVRGSLDDATGKRSSALVTWTFRSKRRDYFELAADEARRLRESINRSYEEIGELIVADLF